MGLTLPAVVLQAPQIAAAVPASSLAPVLGRAYRVLTSQRHRVGETEHRFETERRVVFSREPGGLLADMVLLSVSTDLTGAAGQRFATAAGALRGQSVRVHLTGGGMVTAIDDEERLRALLAAGVASVGGTGTSRPAPTINRAALAAPLTALLAAPEDGRTVSSRSVTLPAVTPGGTALTGTETTRAAAGGRVSIATHAAGTVGMSTISVDR